jgi:hypothetical protein
MVGSGRLRRERERHLDTGLPATACAGASEPTETDVEVEPLGADHTGPEPLPTTLVSFLITDQPPAVVAAAEVPGAITVWRVHRLVPAEAPLAACGAG